MAKSTKSLGRPVAYGKWIETPEVLKQFPKIPAIIAAEVMRSTGTDVNAVRDANLRAAYKGTFGIDAPAHRGRIRVPHEPMPADVKAE